MQIRHFFILACILFSLGCATTSEDENSKRAILHLQLGSTHLMNGNYPLALRELLEANRLDPNNPTVHNNLGLAYLVRDRFVEAETHFNDALRLNPKYTDARNNLGRLYIDLGLYPKAIEQLELAVADLTYDSPEKSYTNLGQALFLINRFEDARPILRTSLKYKRDDCTTTGLYGRTLFELKQFKDAADTLDQAVKLCAKSKSDDVHFYSAMSFYKLGRVELARGRFEEVLQLYPESLYAKKSKEMLEILP